MQSRQQLYRLFLYLSLSPSLRKPLRYNSPAHPTSSSSVAHSTPLRPSYLHLSLSLSPVPNRLVLRLFRAGQSGVKQRATSGIASTRVVDEQSASLVHAAESACGAHTRNVSVSSKQSPILGANFFSLSFLFLHRRRCQLFFLHFLFIFIILATKIILQLITSIYSHLFPSKRFFLRSIYTRKEKKIGKL